MTAASPDIFLSYTREDQATAQRFAEAFEAQGFSVWWDATLRSGEAYDQVTEEALRTAKAVVVLWSKKSAVSRWVRAEATLADRNRTLVPARIEACDLPIMFELTQTAELSHWRGEPDDKLWLAFLGDVRRRVGRDVAASAMVAPLQADEAAAGGVPFAAVLPITHRPGDDELEMLAEDLTEDITRELAQNSFFNVIAAGTMAAWRGQTINYRSLGREVDASYLIEGKVQRAGETVRLTMQLIDPVTGRMLCSARFARNPSAIDTSPEEFAVAVACELGEHIVHIESSRAMTKQGPLTGWDHVMRAWAFTERLGPDSQQSALAESRKAIAAAPDLGLAHALLAMSIGTDRALGLGEIGEAERRTIHHHIKRAMQLDGDSIAILYSISTAYAALDDEEAALRLARRAVELAPNSPMAQFALGNACFATGRTTEAIAAYKEQLRLAPRDVHRAAALMILGICLYIESEVAEAATALDRSLALNPDYCVALMWKAVVAARQGQEQTAKATVLRLRDAEPGMSIDQHLRLLVYYPMYREQLTGTVTIFHRLWEETELAE
jgi:TolB-like protein/Tfp pilus assembly protein PilF